MTHHPHVHMVVPGGGRSLDGSEWVASQPSFFLPVRVLSRRLRRLMLDKLAAAHAAGKLQLFGAHAHLGDADAFAAFLAPLRTRRWFVYRKRPFAGPQAVLADLARYTHRVAIATRRLIAADEHGVTFKGKHYRFEGRDRYKSMTRAPHEFIRRFLIPVLPKGYHRIRHYGLLASGARPANIARARALLAAPEPPTLPDPTTKAAAPASTDHRLPCPSCGGRTIVGATFGRGGGPRAPPSSKPGIRTEAVGSPTTPHHRASPPPARAAGDSSITTSSVQSYALDRRSRRHRPGSAREIARLATLAPISRSTNPSSTAIKPDPRRRRRPAATTQSP